jgi:hypothetical protein
VLQTLADWSELIVLAHSNLLVFSCQGFVKQGVVLNKYVQILTLLLRYDPICIAIRVGVR